MTRWSALGRAPRRVPLLVSGALRRFAADPWRGWAAVRRAAPALQRWIPDPHTPLAEVRRAVAEDRLADAIVALEEVADSKERAVADLAVARARGDLLAVARRRGRTPGERREITAARTDVRALTSPLPVWAGRSWSLSGPPLVRPPRILHVVTNALPRVQAGSTIRTHRVARAQQQMGWDVAVATRPGFPVFHGDVLAPMERHHDGVDYLALLPTLMPSPTAVPPVYARLLGNVVERVRPDVLHAASDHVNARATLEVGRRRGIPVAYEARTLPEESWLSRHGGEGARNRDTYRWLRQRHAEVLRAADVVTTLGESMRAEICEQGVDPARVFVVPNGVPEQFLGPVGSPGEARAALGLPIDQFLLGTVSTMYSYEGLDLLIEAAAMLRGRGIDAACLLVGDGPELARWRALALEAGVPCHSPGRVPASAVPGYLDALDVFVLPRRPDRVTRLVTALKPLEAQARAIPVVGADLPAVAEVLAPGSTLVPGREARTWADALEAYTDPDTRTRDGLAAREWVAACRTWASTMTGYRSAYAVLGLGTAEGVGS
jgi:glycosyltransferase involved in cell wall biosynthesis